ncbi:MAG TPA: hypothetical protein VFM79_07220 [Pelobium sp.]|nr:hypothetical protein [Pelobium sp.]
MATINPQYITDTAGKKLVVLSVDEFETMIDELEELQDIKLYDDSKKEDGGERILFEDYLQQRKMKNV